jgi:asparagine synthase (glutamine-hydrolysing)
MVEYNREKIHNYLSDKTFAEYYPYASRATSMFFMQEYFAVKHLKENKLIPDDSVFIPGHSGDFLGGSQLNKYNISENESIESLSAKILKDKFSLVPAQS